MCTFSDGNKPLWIENVKKIFNYEQYFQFNNSMLYTPESKRDEASKIEWEMGIENIK
jgi:hypothetical protein